MLSLVQSISVWRRRKNFFVSRAAQMPLMIQFGSLTLLALILALGNCYVLWQVMQPENGLQDSINTGQWFGPAIAFGYVFISVAASIALFALILIIYTHMIAAPAEKIATALGRISSGDYDVVVELRTSDQLQDLATAVNDATENCRQRHIKLVRAMDCLAQLAKSDPKLNAPLELLENAIDNTGDL